MGFWGLQIRFEPVQNFLQACDAVIRTAAAGELVVLTMEQAKTCRAACTFEAAEHLQRIRQRAAPVFVGMDEERRGVAVRRIFQRRLVPERIDILFAGTEMFAADIGQTNVAEILEVYHIGEGTLRTGSGKTVCMADDPVYHKPTVGAAANADTGSINIRINCSMQRARPTTDGLPGS